MTTPLRHQTKEVLRVIAPKRAAKTGNGRAYRRHLLLGPLFGCSGLHGAVLFGGGGSVGGRVGLGHLNTGRCQSSGSGNGSGSNGDSRINIMIVLCFEQFQFAPHCAGPHNVVAHVALVVVVVVIGGDEKTCQCLDPIVRFGGGHRSLLCLEFSSFVLFSVFLLLE